MKSMNSKVRTHRVQGSSSVYYVVEADGKMTCYADAAKTRLCVGWKNSRGEKDCKHCRAARAGDTLDNAVAEDYPGQSVSGPDHDTRGREGYNPLPLMSARFIKPMLASTMDSATIADFAGWAVEEKFVGHRAIVMVSGRDVTAWSRSGKSRDLPSQVLAAFAALPNGIYDGELMGKEGGTFADVRRLETRHEAYFVVFDVLNLLGEPTVSLSYDNRRDLIGGLGLRADAGAVRRSVSADVASEADVVAFVAAVWERGGEGAILKRRAARYQPGARSADFVKVKKGGTCVVKVTGFEVGKRGPFSRVCVVDPRDGMETTVKNESKIAAGVKDIGRLLRIDFTEKTAAAFVNPHCDRWEDK